MFCGVMKNLAEKKIRSYFGGFDREVALKAMSYHEVNPCQNDALALASTILKSHLASNRENVRQLISSYIC